MCRIRYSNFDARFKVATGRGVLGVTASSAILLGHDEATEVAEEWELAPAETREHLRDGLAAISPRLVVRLDGAWDAVVHAGPDSVPPTFGRNAEAAPRHLR